MWTTNGFKRMGEKESCLSKETNTVFPPGVGGLWTFKQVPTGNWQY